VRDARPRTHVELAPREAAFDVLRENLEAFAVAIVMALVIKHFCLEAFRIPTESMNPTLLGEDSSPDHQEDRILVDKWAYLFADPERWDVFVFRYPLDKSRNFIKRAVGLPGEEIKIVRGDVWTRRAAEDPWKIATKRRVVREQLYRSVYPPKPHSGDESSDGEQTWWTAEERLDGWRVEGPQRFEFEGGLAARLTYRNQINAEIGKARDIRVRFRVIPQGPGSITLSWSPDGRWRSVLRLVCDTSAGDGSSLAFADGDEAKKDMGLEVALHAGRPNDVEWEIVDGQVRIHLDGVERKVVDFEPPTEEGNQGTALWLSADGAPLTVQNLAIDRDLHYTLTGSDDRPELRTGLKIPDDSFFMLGDNTNSSSDSRKWQATGVKLKDGREIWWNISGESSTRPTDSSGMRRVIDLEGVERTWSRSEEIGSDETRHVSFVPRANVIGRAFYIFWPAFNDFPKSLGGFPRRLRWIH
jgi:signal peptidase I